MKKIGGRRKKKKKAKERKREKINKREKRIDKFQINANLFIHCEKIFVSIYQIKFNIIPLTLLDYY